MSTRTQVAEITINEARSRGYSRNDTLAVLSTFIQESGLDETIWDPTHTTYGVAQQDASYPNRFKGAAAQVKAFFDKLDIWRAKPGASNDIWLNIAWMQQRPNWESAEYWRKNGRIAYLVEIKSRIPAATEYLAEYWPREQSPWNGAKVPAVQGDPVWLEDVWREALGDRLVVHDGWKERGTGGVMGVIWGTMIHHTGNDNERVEIIRDGVMQPSGWLPGPLSQALITRDGKLHLIAVGPCNHAGSGNWKDLTDGNRQAIGIECAYDGNPLEWPQQMVITMRDATAAISKHLGKRAADSVCGHKEYAKPQGRKPDPANMSMDWFRDEVQKDIDGFVFPGEPLTSGPAIIEPPVTSTPPVPPNALELIYDQDTGRWEMLGWRTQVEMLAEIGKALKIEGADPSKRGMVRGPKPAQP